MTLEAYLKYTHKESICHKFSEALGSILQQRKNSPSQFKCWDCVIHRKHREQKHERELPYDCPSDIPWREFSFRDEQQVRNMDLHCTYVDQLIFIELEVCLEA